MRKLFLLPLLLLAACGEPKFVQSAKFHIAVDSINTPATISATAPFTVRFFGLIGPSDCFSFDRFETQKSDSAVDVVAVGNYYTTGQCRAQEVRLDGQELQVPPPFSDPFTVVVHQPSGARLTHVIPVQ